MLMAERIGKPSFWMLYYLSAVHIGKSRKHCVSYKIFGIIFIVLGALGVLTHFDLLGGVEIPILQLGLPAVLSIYFDLFSGFVQAFVFSLLSMVYIAGACPPPDEAE